MKLLNIFKRKPKVEVKETSKKIESKSEEVKKASEKDIHKIIIEQEEVWFFDN